MKKLSAMHGLSTAITKARYGLFYTAHTTRISHVLLQILLTRKDDKELARNYKEKKEDEEELCLVVRADWLQWDTTHTAFEIDGFEKHTS